MANDKPEISAIVAAFVNTLDDEIIRCATRQITVAVCLKNI